MAHYSKCGSFSQGKGWRRTIGNKVGKDGRLMPCRFWLGMDKAKATATALKIESLWVGLDAPYWTPEALAIAEEIRVRAKATNVAESTADAFCEAMVRSKTVLIFKEAIERYRHAKLNDASISDASKHAIRCRTNSLEKSPLANSPMASIGAQQLSALVAYWLQRPSNGKGDPISETSARLIVKTARAVFDWADGVGLWTAPRRFDRLFKLPRTVNTPTIKIYSVNDLARLYTEANPFIRMLILLSLNCGFCSMEAASLRRDEIDLAAKVISRRRQKSGVAMTWNLWHETVRALRRGMANEGELALGTNGGKPLVWYSAGGHRVDAIVSRWRRLSKKAGVGGSFKTLRKTAATMMRSIGGVEVSELFLAHSEKSMAKFYSLPDPKAMETALTKMRRQLAPVFRTTLNRRSTRAINQLAMN